MSPLSLSEKSEDCIVGVRLTAAALSVGERLPGWPGGVFEVPHPLPLVKSSSAAAIVVASIRRIGPLIAVQLLMIVGSMIRPLVRAVKRG